MTIHVLIACSKKKSLVPSQHLVWNEDTTISSWSDSWNSESKTIPASQLYNGRSFKQQMELSKNNEDARAHILSAGFGLISDVETKIPSYEATLIKTNYGPSKKEWHLLPNGGIKNINLEKNDLIVSFAPPQYHQILLTDPDFDKISSKLIVPSTSPLASKAKFVIEIHPRAKEVLGVASTDLNTEFLRIYLSEGSNGFENLFLKGEKLPSKIERISITDDELVILVGELQYIGTLDGIVRHLRDNLLIRASVERISQARKKGSS
jgi:hypothetical protein